MQPLQCVLQQHVPIHAAITMRFASTPCRTPSENRLRPKRSNRTCRTHTHTHTRYPSPSSPPAATLHGKTQGFVLRLPPHNKPHATVMQPLQCVHAAITMQFASTRCRTPRENRLRPKGSKWHLPHTQGTLHRCLQPLYTEKHEVSCSGFLKPHATFMQHPSSDVFCSVMYFVVWCILVWCIVVRCIVMCCIVVRCIVVWCIVMRCIVMWCIVKRCIVMWCMVTTSPPFVRCIVVWCIGMWCIVLQFYLSVTRKVASQLPGLYIYIFIF